MLKVWVNCVLQTKQALRDGQALNIDLTAELTEPGFANAVSIAGLGALSTNAEVVLAEIRYQRSSFPRWRHPTMEASVPGTTLYGVR